MVFLPKPLYLFCVLPISSCFFRIFQRLINKFVWQNCQKLNMGLSVPNVARYSRWHTFFSGPFSTPPNKHFNFPYWKGSTKTFILKKGIKHTLCKTLRFMLTFKHFIRFILVFSLQFKCLKKVPKSALQSIWGHWVSSRYPEGPISETRHPEKSLAVSHCESLQMALVGRSHWRGQVGISSPHLDTSGQQHLSQNIGYPNMRWGGA